jgi:hypothetical protein
MISCDPNTLIQAANCFECIPVGHLEAVITYLYCQYANKSTGPPVPTSIDIADGSSPGNTIVTWTNSTNPTTNEVWKSTDGGATFVLAASVAGTVHTFIDVAAMAANTIWYYKVRACTGGNCSAFTDIRGASNNLNATTFSLPKLVHEYATISFAGVVGGGVLDLSLLRDVLGTLDAQNKTGITSVLAPVLNLVQGALFLNGCTSCASINLNLLSEVDGNFYLYGGLPITSLSLPALTLVGGTFSMDDTNLMTSLSLPVLNRVGQSLSVGSGGVASGIPTLSLPSITQIGDTLFANSLPNLTTVTAPLLQIVTNAIQVLSCPNLTSVNFNALQNCGNFLMSSNISLATVNFPALTAETGDFDFSNSTNLATFSIPVLIFANNGQVINFNGCGLSLGSSAAGTGVDGILRRCVVSALTNSNIDTSGGTSATPDAPGQADKTTLTTAGCIVTTN